jgi:hypothetical protein
MSGPGKVPTPLVPATTVLQGYVLSFKIADESNEPAYSRVTLLPSGAIWTFTMSRVVTGPTAAKTPSDIDSATNVASSWKDVIVMVRDARCESSSRKAND